MARGVPGLQWIPAFAGMTVPDEQRRPEGRLCHGGAIDQSSMRSPGRVAIAFCTTSCVSVDAKVSMKS